MNTGSTGLAPLFCFVSWLSDPTTTKSQSGHILVHPRTKRQSVILRDLSGETREGGEGGLLPTPFWRGFHCLGQPDTPGERVFGQGWCEEALNRHHFDSWLVSALGVSGGVGVYSSSEACVGFQGL
ncbi:hypothetical protein FA13DRAFT_323391 [Coprinellus micaceus]|uniref:Uncharacterized protein n=1 Tax=Coprinellus micaceus TaxID=71717 RepID=A0A4Y7SFE8_COPMI|nr:hypothetical protein FA13DRAFT_323391 [Coprinellus micaceus]